MKINKQKGIVRTIIIIIIALLVISYLGINLRQLATSPTTESNFSYVWNGTVYIWDNYLETPVTNIYDFFIKYIWDPALSDIEKISSGQTPASGQSSNTGAVPVTM